MVLNDEDKICMSGDDCDGKKMWRGMMWTTFISEPKPRIAFFVFEMFLIFFGFLKFWDVKSNKKIYTRQVF